MLPIGLVSAQTFVFEPDWEEGESYKMNMVSVNKTYDNDVLDLDEEVILDPVFTVEKKSPEAFLLSVNFKNVLQSNLYKVSEDFGTDIEPKDILLKYSVSRADGEYQLINFEEARRFLNESISDMRRLIVEEYGDEQMGELFDSLMMPVQVMFMDEEVLSQYFGDTLETLLLPYYKELSVDEPYLVVDKEENPFAPGDSLVATSEIWIISIDESNGLATIGSETEVDLSSFKEMMKSMMAAFVQGATQNVDSTSTDEDIQKVLAEKQAEMDSLRMDLSFSSEILLNTKTLWPIKVVRNMEMIMNMGELRNGEVYSTTTATFERL